MPSNDVDAGLVVVGRLWVEYVARGPWLPKPGETVESTTFEDGLGGRGGRQAVAAARLGVPVAIVASIGPDDRADAMLRWLGAENVDARQLRRARDVSSGAALVHLGPSRARQAMIFPHTASAISQLDVEAASARLASARAVLVSLQVPREAARRALALASLAHARIVLDAAGAANAVPDDVLRLVDVLHATMRETEVLTGVEVRGPATAGVAAESLRVRGLAAALIDAGPEGHLLVTERGSRMFPRLGVANADEEASDEAFVAGLAAALAEGRTLEDAATVASAAQALMGPQQGVAAFPKRDAVLRLLEATTGRTWEIDEAA